MNITVKLTTTEAASLLSPLVADKLDNGNFGGRPEVTVEIANEVSSSSYVPPPVSSRLSHLHSAFVRGHGQCHNKIAMIKEVRTLTGWSLKDSKDFVETILGALGV